MRVLVEKDVVFARVGEESLALDIYRPDKVVQPPTVLYLHGGGWAVGDKADGSSERLEQLARNGVAVASANYRLTPMATYPAQIHDVKAAVRWLRAKGAQKGLAVDRLAVWGASAGAYLASMAGLTAGDSDLEGTVGDHRDKSSAVQAVVSWFGPSDLAQTSRRTWLERRIFGVPFENALFKLETIALDNSEVREGSPINRVGPGAPPFLIAHGSLDRMVAESEGRALHDALVRYGCDVTMMILGGAGHEDPKFDSEVHLAMTALWLKAHLTRPSQ
jgi:acetyl esterase/lipase